jgi:hypothetical protein
MKLSHLVLSVLLISSFVTELPIGSKAAAIDRSANSVTLKSQTVRWNSGKKNDGSPNSRAVTVRYPIVTGLQDAAILKKVQTAISVKAIVGQSLTELKQDSSPWLTDVDYIINYNQNNILDLTYQISGMGAYPSTSQKRVSIDLKTGNLLRSKDLFKTDTNVALVQTIEEMMQREIRMKIAEVRKQDPTIAKDIFTKHHFQQKDLNDFTIGKKGITFHYNFDFVHAIKAAEPSGAYFISYDKLSRYIRPDGAVGFALGSSRK